MQHIILKAWDNKRIFKRGFRNSKQAANYICILTHS